MLDDLLRRRLAVKQVLVEFHHDNLPGVRRSQTVRAILKMIAAGYRLLHQHGGNHTLSLAEGFVKVTEGFIQRGEDESGGADVLRARAIVASRRDQLGQAQAGEVAALNLLQVLTGIDFSVPIDVARIAQNLPTVADFTSFTDEQVKQRPELSQLDFQKRAALEDARAVRLEGLPQLTYTVNGGFDAANFHPLKRYAGGSAIVRSS